MAERLDTGIIYYRGKADAFGAITVGLILLGFAAVVLTQEGIGGIPFSADLMAMSTYLALPLGVVLVLANLRHAIARGPTLAAGKEGISVLYPAGRRVSLTWAEVAGFSELTRQGRSYLGLSVEDPARLLPEFKRSAPDLLCNFGPKTVHLKIEGKMLDERVTAVINDLEEMRQVHSWRT